MATQSINLLLFMAVAVLLWLGLFVIPGYLVKKAVYQVMRIFRQTDSLCSQQPKTVDQLGLSKPDFLHRLTRPKDYKPFALQALIRTGIIRVGDEGKLCLREEKLKGR